MQSKFSMRAFLRGTESQQTRGRDSGLYLLGMFGTRRTRFSSGIRMFAHGGFPPEFTTTRSFMKQRGRMSFATDSLAGVGKENDTHVAHQHLTNNDSTALSRAELDRVMTQINRAWATYGHSEYIGEAVSQIEHSLQAAHFANEKYADDELTIATLLHDVGHALGLARMAAGDKGVKQMDRCGIVGHEHLGYFFCKELGFPERVCWGVRNHVHAKRYLTAKDSGYYDRLSDASRTTLRWQGGPMSADELQAWEENPWHEDALRIRSCDEIGKDPDAKVPELNAYRDMIKRVLEKGMLEKRSS